jgi:hypothetical protein
LKAADNCSKGGRYGAVHLQETAILETSKRGNEPSSTPKTKAITQAG